MFDIQPKIQATSQVYILPTIFLKVIISGANWKVLYECMSYGSLMHV